MLYLYIFLCDILVKVQQHSHDSLLAIDAMAGFSKVLVITVIEKSYQHSTLVGSDTIIFYAFFTAALKRLNYSSR